MTAVTAASGATLARTTSLTQLRLRCSHGAALLVDGRAQATHTDCVLGVCLLEIKENMSLESESGEA